MALSSITFSKSFPANDSIRLHPISLPYQSSNLQCPIKPTFQNHSNKLLFSDICSRSSTKTKVSFFPAFFTKTQDAKALKLELLEAIEPLDRGADASPEDQQRIDQVCSYFCWIFPLFKP